MGENLKENYTEKEEALSIISKILFPILITSKKTREILYANPYAQNQYETTLENLIGMQVSEFYTDNKQRDKIISSIKEDGKVENLEMSFKTMKGNTFIGLLSLTDIIYKGEDCFMGMVKDISIQKEQEKKLARQSKLEALGEMISNIAHHWRQPLNAISLASSGIITQHELDILDDEALIDSISVIDQQAQFLSKTLDSFRDMIDDAQLEKTNFKLNTLIKYLIHKHKFDFKLELSLDDDVQLFGARANMEKAIISILNNSNEQFQKQTNITNKYVTIKTIKKKYDIIIEIEDSAGGISEDIIDKIYEPYFTTSHMSRGKGLGLYNTHKFITVDMRGLIDVSNSTIIHENEETLGAKVTIELPIINPTNKG